MVLCFHGIIFLQDWCLFLEFFLYLLKSNYDIIHAFPFISALPAWLYGLISRKPIVFSVFALKNNWLENFLSFGLSYNLLVTDNLEIAKQYRRKNINIKYLPDGVDIESFDKVKINKKGRFPRLLFVGRFHAQKGLPNLLKAVKNLILDFPNLKLILIGYGSIEKELKLLAGRLGIKKYIQIKKPKFGVDLIKEYKKSHIFVLPSLYEGQGIVVLEAWAAKIPVVATKVGSLSSLIESGINGYLVLPDSVDDLVNKIEMLLKNKKLTKMGENGYSLVKQKFYWDVIVQKLYREYIKLI